MFKSQALGYPLRGGRIYYRSLLVHRVYVVCESRCYLGSIREQYVCWYQTRGYNRIYHRAVGRSIRGYFAFSLAISTS
jgi:hypothetical protein